MQPFLFPSRLANFGSPMSKTISMSILALVASMVLPGCKDASKDTHPQQLVTKRQAIFKDFTRTLEPMGLVARDRQPYNPREFNVQALELQRLSTLPWGYFTADGNYPPTRAKPDVWQKPAEFKQAQDNYAQTVSQLLKASQSGDLDAIRPAVDAVQKSCKSCHDQFRNSKAGD
jgi:cytochrome c556